LTTTHRFISKNLKELKQFVKSTSFSRALLVGFAVTLPIILGLKFEKFEIGLALCFGAFWCSPSDIVGSFEHKKKGIFISAGLVMVVSFIGTFLHYETWLSLPVLGFLAFGIAYISVYGFRASLISFSGLLALVLSFAHDSLELKTYEYAILVGTGGLWYFLLAKIWNLIYPKAETEELLSETYVLTADFLETRGELIGRHKDRKALQSKLLKIQSELTVNHQTLREILIFNRSSSGKSNYQEKRLLIFVQLVEILETAIANPVNYNRMDALLNEHPTYIQTFQNLIFEMSKQLRIISVAGSNKKKLPPNGTLKECFDKVKHEISLLHESPNNDYLISRNWFDYQEKQFNKLKRIKWLLGDANTMEIEFIDRKNAKRFIAPQDNDPMLLVRNFSFKSTIFRHSLRLAVTVMLGYTLGSLLPFQNPYWILLTIIVIMRPNYGLTKNRAKDRMIGTLIGGAVAFGMVFLIQDIYLYGILGVSSLIIALALVQKNSKASAIFVTLSVVFIYAILSPDVLNVIKFRVIDTLVGATLSYFAILWLWPSWESVEITESIQKSIRSNKEFLINIKDYYENKGSVNTTYRIARKEAFLETSNLNSAFQRMAQEPKAKQKRAEKIYELVVLNHTFLASLASLSSYFQSHETSKASEQFEIATNTTVQNLELSLQNLSAKTRSTTQNTTKNDAIFKQQLTIFKTSHAKELILENKPTERELQEAHLVWEQLQWLYSISTKMLKLSTRV
jgi:uncharacterized membrane protein YccC